MIPMEEFLYLNHNDSWHLFESYPASDFLLCVGGGGTQYTTPCIPPQVRFAFPASEDGVEYREFAWSPEYDIYVGNGVAPDRYEIQSMIDVVEKNKQSLIALANGVMKPQDFIEGSPYTSKDKYLVESRNTTEIFIEKQGISLFVNKAYDSGTELPNVTVVHDAEMYFDLPASDRRMKGIKYLLKNLHETCDFINDTALRILYGIWNGHMTSVDMLAYLEYGKFNLRE